MANVIEFNEFAPTHAGSRGELCCWLCQKGVSARALFCHHCGTIQPVRELDHFARLGLERRVDVDMETLDHQYEALKRTLDPGRFTIRGVGERGHAARQMEKLDEAYDTLRDPMRRGRYWLVLHSSECGGAVRPTTMVAELSHELEKAAEAAQCDRVAWKAGQAMEQGIIGLMQALRGQNWQEATATLAELDGLEALLTTVRHRRATLAPDHRGGDGLRGVN